MKKTTEKRIASILKRASVFDKNHVKQPYYLEPDFGETYCLRCAMKEAANGGGDLQIGDSSANHDTLCICDVCGVMLDGWLTDWGAMEELCVLEESGFNIRKGEDCYIWSLCENSFIEGTNESNRLIEVAMNSNTKGNS